MKYIIQNKKQNDHKRPTDTFQASLAPTATNLPPYYQHLVNGKILSIVQELRSSIFGIPATPHASRDSRDDPQLTLHTLQQMENSSPATANADINITGLLPQQPSTLPSYYENSHTLQLDDLGFDVL